MTIETITLQERCAEIAQNLAYKPDQFTVEQREEMITEFNGIIDEYTTRTPALPIAEGTRATLPDERLASKIVELWTLGVLRIPASIKARIVQEYDLLSGYLGQQPIGHYLKIFNTPPHEEE